MFNTWFFLALAAMLLDWAAVAVCWRWERCLTKPLVLVMLTIWFSLAGGWRSAGTAFGLALLFSLLGDICLLDSLLSLRPPFFQAGLVAFLAAQGAYTVGFNSGALPGALAAIAALGVVAAASFFIGRRVVRALRRNGEGAAQIVPVVLYMIVISLMLASALTTLARPGWALLPAGLAALGACLLYFSDSILASDRFIKPVRFADLLVMTTYHLGQLMIITGVLLRY